LVKSVTRKLSKAQLQKGGNRTTKRKNRDQVNKAEEMEASLVKGLLSVVPEKRRKPWRTRENASRFRVTLASGRQKSIEKEGKRYAALKKREKEKNFYHPGLSTKSLMTFSKPLIAGQKVRSRQVGWDEKKPAAAPEAIQLCARAVGAQSAWKAKAGRLFLHKKGERWGERGPCWTRKKSSKRRAPGLSRSARTGRVKIVFRQKGNDCSRETPPSKDHWNGNAKIANGKKRKRETDAGEI